MKGYIKVKGIEDIKAYLTRAADNIIASTDDALEEVSQYIEDKSNDYLYTHVQGRSSRLHPDWGWSRRGDAIYENWSHKVTRTDSGIQSIVKNDSRHAAAVEFGSGVFGEKHTPIKKRMTFWLMPEVAYYYHDIVKVDQIEGQPPIAYFRNTIFNPQTKQRLLAAVTRDIRSSLR